MTMRLLKRMMTTPPKRRTILTGMIVLVVAVGVALRIQQQQQQTYSDLEELVVDPDEVVDGNGDVRGHEHRVYEDDTTRTKSSKYTDTNTQFYVGTGIYDMTGPAAQINFMGYAKTTQTAHGIHQRLRARAFIVSQYDSSEEDEADEDEDGDDDDVEKEDSVESDNDSEDKSTMTSSSSTETKTESLVMRRSRTMRRRGSHQRRDEHIDNPTSNKDTKKKQRRSLRSFFRLFDNNDKTPDGNEAFDTLAAKKHLDPSKTICFVSIDAGMGSDLLNTLVLKRLEELLPEQHYSGQEEEEESMEDHDDEGRKKKRRLCHMENLSISGTHTHSAPGGFLQYALYQITSLGFSKETMDTYVEGVAQALLRAYNSLNVGTVRMTKNTFMDPEYTANINRSPASYLLNPEEERNKYSKEGDTDKTMLQLEFSKLSQQSQNKPSSLNLVSSDRRSRASSSQHAQRQTPRLIGVLNWYAVHGTSMNSTNKLISGDNKGYASYLMEKHLNGQDVLPGHGQLVAAFASTNLGDVSPNTDGPRCIDTGEPCDLVSSTCNGRNAMCIASGPGKNMQESTEIIGRRQFDMSIQLLQQMTTNKTGSSIQGDYLESSVSFRHSFVDMSNLNVTLENGGVVRTCPSALGYGFAAGTTDGPGGFDFRQGENTSNPFWNIIGSFLSPPSREQKECHHPKPILLNTGNVKTPYYWDPETVPISIFRIGRLFILNVPCEMTTMAGRRLRAAIKNIAVQHGVSQPEVTIAGLANSYTHYVTTFEEYAGQRYEAASTLYGPHTLSAYIQEFERITVDLLDGSPSTSADPPKDLSDKQISLIPPVVLDTIGLGQGFGSMAIESKDSYVRGIDTVFVSFRSANPRNNQRIEGTFLTVDHLLDDGSWKTLYVDGDWCTKYVWKSDVDILGVSFAEIYWQIPSDVQQGIYRICHYGTRRTLLGDLDWILYHTPDWWAFDMFGSMAAGILTQLVKLLARISDSFAIELSAWEIGHLKDFHGCSRSFLVRAS